MEVDSTVSSSGSLRAAARVRATRLATWSMLLALLCFAVFAAVYWVAVRTTTGQVLDNALYTGRFDATPSLRREALGWLSRVSVFTLLLGALVVAVVAFLRVRLRLAVTGVAVMVVAVLATQILKRFVLARPVLAEDPFALTPNSFPSGHAAAVMSVAVALLLVVGPSLRTLVALGGAGVTALIGFATQVAGWHRASDTVGSVLLVTGVAMVAISILALWRGVTALSRRSGWWSTVIVAGALATLVAVLDWRLARNLADRFATTGRELEDEQLLAYATSALLTGAVAVLCFALLIFLLHRVDLDPSDEMLVSDASVAPPPKSGGGKSGARRSGGGKSTTGTSGGKASKGAATNRTSSVSRKPATGSTAENSRPGRRWTSFLPGGK